MGSLYRVRRKIRPGTAMGWGQEIGLGKSPYYDSREDDKTRREKMRKMTFLRSRKEDGV